MESDVELSCGDNDREMCAQDILYSRKGAAQDMRSLSHDYTGDERSVRGECTRKVYEKSVLEKCTRKGRKNERNKRDNAKREHQQKN